MDEITACRTVSVSRPLFCHSSEQKKMALITQTFQKHKVPYKWGYPLNLLASCQDETVPISSSELGLKLCIQW